MELRNSISLLKNHPAHMTMNSTPMSITAIIAQMSSIAVGFFMLFISLILGWLFKTNA
jgi:hypothetical protein